jgi:oxygen-independent coproporphyrinogen-3 oxidase
MLQSVVSQTRSAGYERSSIWSFNRPGSSRYTTVTRNAFVGIGAGATSRLGDYFWLNTFSVAEYIKAMEDGSPRSLATQLTSADRMAYWLFWPCYNLSIDTGACRSVCGTALPRRVRAVLPLLGLLGITRREGDVIRFTDWGAYLFHLVEKKYTQTYLRPMWEACLAEPWPERVVL